MYQWKVKVSSAFHDMRHGLNLYRFLCVPHRSQGFFFPGASRSEGFNVCNKIRQTCASIVIILCVSPALIIVSESFMIVSYSIKYQCPGVTVPKCRRFWRALICLLIPRSCDFISYAKMKPKKFVWNFYELQLPFNTHGINWRSFGPRVARSPAVGVAMSCMRKYEEIVCHHAIITVSLMGVKEEVPYKQNMAVASNYQTCQKMKTYL